MPVIGRLDSQVEEVLIAPIARRHEREAREREEKQSRQEEVAQAVIEKSDEAGAATPDQAVE